MKRILNRSIAAPLIIGFCIAGSFAFGDDDTTRDEPPGRRRVRVVDRVSARFWIGVHAVPIDNALKSQLGLEDRLIVRSVMPNSPAGKAGLVEHDILLKFGEHELADLKDLLKAVAANEGEGTKVVVLRAGKETTLDIQPTERPETIEADPAPDAWKPLVEAWLGGPTGGRFRIVGPGVFEELPPLPGNLSINITKQNDEPAKIVVKRNDDSWEITENDLDTLPEDIREHVRRQLDHQLGRAAHTLRLEGVEDGEIRISPGVMLPEGINRKIREQLERSTQELEVLQERLEILREKMNTEDPFKAFQEQMEEFRRELDELRKRGQTTDTPTADTRDT